MKYQLKWFNFLPSFVVLLFVPILLGVMSLGHSQYALLGEMSMLQNFSNNAMLSWAGLSTIVLLIGLPMAFVFAVANFLCSRLYNYRLMSTLLFVYLGLLVPFIGIYLYAAMTGSVTDAVTTVTSPLFEPLNSVALVFEVLLYVAYAFAYVFGVIRPYREIQEAGLAAVAKSLAEEEKTSDISSMSKEELIAFVQKAEAEGKLTKDEAVAILEKLQSH
jgi:hypothetical protein